MCNYLPGLALLHREVRVLAGHTFRSPTQRPARRITVSTIRPLRRVAARGRTVAMQYIVLLSHRTVALPSVVMSQNVEVAVCRPAPFFCMITAVTMYLKGLFRSFSLFMQLSITFDVHCATLVCW